VHTDGHDGVQGFFIGYGDVGKHGSKDPREPSGMDKGPDGMVMNFQFPS